MIQKIKNSILLQTVCIILITLVVLMGTMVFAQQYIRQTAVTSAETLADSLLRQANNSMNIYEDTMRYNAAHLCRYPIMEKLQEGNSLRDSGDDVQLSSYFSQIVLKNSEVISAILFDTQMNEIASYGKKATLPERQNFLRSVEEFNADYYFDRDDYCYAFYYPIFSALYGKGTQAGMCVFILDHWVLDGIAQSTIDENSAAILVSDSNDLDLSFYSSGTLSGERSMEALKHKKDIIYREGDWQTGIRFAVAASVSVNEMNSTASRSLIQGAFLLASLLLAFIIFFSYHQMVRPLHRMARFIDRSITHPDERLNSNRTDDIGIVASKLDHMLDENQRMIQEIRDGKIRLYETQLARQKMEILAFRNQINPHFLYNTLSCMRDMALIHDEEDIAEMAMCLSDIFRYAVKGSNIVTVRDELEYIDKYAKIIDYRFMGKITIETYAAEDVLDKPVIRFFLQPLVENAVFHALEASMEPGFVDVGIELDEGRLEMLIEDDGCGMDEETLAKVREQLENPGESTSIGLSNIVQRLQLFYGSDYTLRIDSKLGEGTRIRISVPDHTKGTE